MTLLPQDPKEWIGRSETRRERLTLAPAALLSATLDHAQAPDPGGALPLLWHWLYFLADTPQSQLRPDGHPLSSGVLPPVPLPRRMFAGARVQVQRPLQLDSEVTRYSRIAAVNSKQGRSGQLLFLQIHHEYHDAHGVAMSEYQDVVYREAVPPQSVAPAAPAANDAQRPPVAAPRPGPSPAAPVALHALSGAQWTRQVHADPALLFRYSALTFNAHRIHYDLPYTTRVEGYPGLVVQGMLVATLLSDLVQRQRPNAAVRAFTFRAVAPLFCGAPFALCGQPGEAGQVRLWAVDPEGTLAMEASAQLA